MKVDFTRRTFNLRYFKTFTWVCWRCSKSLSDWGGTGQWRSYWIHSDIQGSQHTLRLVHMNVMPISMSHEDKMLGVLLIVTLAVDDTFCCWGVSGQREETDPTVWISTHQGQLRGLQKNTCKERERWGMSTNLSPARLIIAENSLQFQWFQHPSFYCDEMSGIHYLVTKNIHEGWFNYELLPSILYTIYYILSITIFFLSV